MFLLKAGFFLFAGSGVVLAVAYFAQKAVAKMENDPESNKRVPMNYSKGVACLVASVGVFALASTTTKANLLLQLQKTLLVVAFGGAMIGLAYFIQLLVHRKKLAKNEKTYLLITGMACILAAIATSLIATAITRI